LLLKRRGICNARRLQPWRGVKMLWQVWWKNCWLLFLENSMYFEQLQRTFSYSILLEQFWTYWWVYPESVVKNVRDFYFASSDSGDLTQAHCLERWFTNITPLGRKQRSQSIFLERKKST
jgi:hypothetical protein